MRDEQEFVYERASEQLVLHIPELRDAYRRELEWWGSEAPGAHVVYDEVLIPYISALLTSGEDQTLKRVFEFIERLATAADTRLRDLVAVTICEPLLADRAGLDQARRYMGKETRRILKKVQQG
jgi:hypothetical protein